MESPVPPAQLTNSLSSANPQNASSSSTGPQIRSRITVVCAECKRLKLKCDRRAPCGSCTKRDTVVRCIYSPAAAEKVDLHSLNNRLIQVEAILQMITNGQQPPAFQSIYPVAGLYSSGMGLGSTTASNAANNNTPTFSANSPSVSQQPSSQHQHHHHYAAPPSTTNDSRLMLSPQDVSTIWLEDLDLGISRIPSTATTNTPSASNSQTNSTQQLHTHHPHTRLTASNAGNLGYIKLEPSTVDVDFSYSQPSDSNANSNNNHGFGRSIVIDIDSNATSHIPSRSSTPPPAQRANVNHFPQYHQQQNHPRAGPSGSTSASLFSLSSVAAAAQAQLLLPALSIYYPVPSISPPGSSPSSSAAFPFQQPTHTSPTNHFTSSTSSAACISPISNHAANSATTAIASNSAAAASVNGYIFPSAHKAQLQNSSSITLMNPHSNSPPAHTPPSSQAPSTRPQVTPALLALLPPAERCKTLLERAGEVLKVRPVPLPLPVSSDLDLDGVEDGTNVNMNVPRNGMDEAGAWDWGGAGRGGEDDWNGNEDGDDGTSEGGAMAGRRKGKHGENARQTRRGGAAIQGHVHPPTKASMTSWKAFESRCINLLSGSSSGPVHLARLKRRQERVRERERELERERKEREKKEKAKEARRARQIYFGGIIGLQAPANSASSSHVSQLQDAEMEDGANRDKDPPPSSSSSLVFGDSSKNSGAAGEDSGAGDEQSLTFFSTVCAVLAIGALASTSPPSSSLSPRSTSILGRNSSPTTSVATDSAAFFYALSQQALSIWEIHLSSSSPSAINIGTENNREESDADKERTDETEKERIQSVLAYIVGVEYLQLLSSVSASGHGKGKEDTRAEEGGVIYALVGKAVKAARAIGLDREAFITSTLTRKVGTGTGDTRDSINLGHNANGAGMGKRRREKDGAEAEREKAKDLEERERLEKKSANEEWRRMLLCHVTLLDLFTSDAQGLQQHISSSANASAKLPPSSATTSSLDFSSAAVTSGHNDHYGLHNDGEHEDVDESNDPHNRTRQPSHYSKKIFGDSDTLGTEHSYLDARYRLAQIAQSIKTRVTNPDCCCGYTLDQATSLQDDISRWQSGLPIAFKLPASASGISELQSNPSVPVDKEKDKLVLKMQSCELSIMANMLLVKVYTPFLRNASTSAVAVQSPSSTTTTTSSPTGISVAYQTTMKAGQSIVRATNSLQSVRTKMPGGTDEVLISIPHPDAIASSTSNSHSASTTLEILPAMFDFYPLEKVVFDAVVICAHAALVAGQGNPKLSSLSALAFTVDGTQGVMEDVSVGLNMLSDMCAGPGRGIGEAQKKVIGALYRRLSLHNDGTGGLNSLKRKHGEIELVNPFVDAPNGYSTMANGVGGGSNGDTSLSDFDFGHNHNGPQTSSVHFQQPFSIIPPGTSSSTTSRSSVPPSSAQANALTSFPQDRMLRSEQPKNDLALSVAAARLSTAAARSAEKEHGQDKDKERKHAKKSHPVVGVRVRSGKDIHNSSSSRSRGQSVSGPLMTSIPRPLPSSNGSSAEVVLAFQQKQKMQAIENVDDTQRSRSDSFGNQLQQPEQQHTRRLGSDPEYSLPFGQPSDEVMQRKTFGVHKHAPAHQQQLSPTQVPFTPQIIDQTRTMYDQTHTQASFDNGPPPSSADVMAYSNTVSSPFSNSAGPPSSSGSPFASTSTASSGHPSTPTFNGHHPTPPVFGPQPPVLPSVGGSPTTYFHPSNTFNDSYSSPPSSSQHHQPGQSMSLMDMGMDQNMVSVSENAVYDKPQQQDSMYDVKPTSIGGNHAIQHMHMQQQQQHRPQHHQQHISIDPTPRSYGEDMNMVGQGQQISIGMAVSAAWPGAAGAQQPHTVQGPPTYWGNESEYRFYT